MNELPPLNRKLDQYEKMDIEKLGKAILIEPNHVARIELISRLRETNHKFAIPRIEFALYDDNHEVIDEAAKALASMNHRDAISAIRRAIRMHLGADNIRLRSFDNDSIESAIQKLSASGNIIVSKLWEHAKQFTKH